MLDAEKLNEAIKQQGLTISVLADNVGINKSTFYRKLRDGGDKFQLWEIESIVKHLRITKHDAIEIFLP